MYSAVAPVCPIAARALRHRPPPTAPRAPPPPESATGNCAMVDTRDIPWSGTDARGRRSTRRRAGTHRALLVLDVGARLDQPPHLGGVAVTRRLEQRRERHREAHLRRRSALVLVQERARNCHGSLFSALRTLLRTATAAPLRSSSSAARCPRGCCAAPRRGALPPRGKHREASPRQKSKVRGRLDKGSKVTGVTEENRN